MSKSYLRPSMKSLGPPSVVLALLCACAGCLPAQTPGTSTVTLRARLLVSAATADAISVQARDIPLPQLVAELQRQVHIPIHLSARMQKQTLTVECEEPSLALALATLAPQVELDELVTGGSRRAPRPLAAYLSDFNEMSIPRSTSQPALPDTILFAGETDDISAPTRPPAPLRVQWQDGLLTLHSVRQPLHAVLYALAEQLGIPFSLQAQTDELLDLTMNGVTLDELMRQLPETVQLYRRLSYPGGTSTPLRLVLNQVTDETQRPSH